MHVMVWILTGALGAAALFGLARGFSRTRGSAVPVETAAANALHGLEERIARLGEFERRILSHVLHRKPVARDINSEFEKSMTLGERMADHLARFGGSWTFMACFGATLIGWIAYNVEWPGSFDPYPFILLNLLLSCIAAAQAPVILMSQNRMSERDRLDARHDYEVNLKAEMEIMGLHGKLDELQQREWGRLLEIQERQLETLARIERALSTSLATRG